MIRKAGPFVTTMENAPEYNVLLLIANGESQGQVKVGLSFSKVTPPNKARDTAYLRT
jgi:hypothetical protein